MDASHVILDCINVLELSNKKFESLSELADPDLISNFLSILSNKNIQNIEDAEKLFGEHFVKKASLVDLKLAMDGDVLELALCYLLFLYIAMLTNPSLRAKLLKASLVTDTEYKFKYLIESIHKRGRGISRKYLEILVKEDLGDKGSPKTFNQNPTSSVVYSYSPKRSNGQSPLKNLLQSPSFRLRKIVEDKNAEMKRLTQKITQLEAEKQELELLNETIAAKNQKAEIERGKLREKIHELRKDQEESESMVQNSRQESASRISSLQRNNKQLLKDNDQINSQLQTLLEENTELSTKLENVEKRLRLAYDERTKLLEFIDSLQQKCSAHEILIEEQACELQDFKGKLEELQLYLQENAKSFNKTVEDDSFDVSMMNAENSLCGNSSLRASLESQNLGSAVIDIMLREAQDEIKELQSKIQSLEQDLQSANSQKTELLKSHNEASKELQDSNNKISSLSNELASASATLTQLTETVNVYAEKESLIHKKLADFQESFGLELDSQCSYQEQIEKIKTELLMKQDEHKKTADALRNEKYQSEQLVKNAQEEVLLMKKEIEEEKTASKSSMDTLERQHDESMAHLRTEMEEANKMHSNKESQLMEELQRVRKEDSESKEQVRVCNQVNNQLTEDLENALAEIENLEISKKEQTEKLCSVSLELKQAESNVEKLGKEKAQLSLLLDQHEVGRIELEKSHQLQSDQQKKENNDLLQSITQLKDEYNAITEMHEEEKRNLAAKIEVLREEVNEKTENINVLEGKHAQDVESLRLEITETKQLLTQSKEQCDSLKYAHEKEKQALSYEIETMSMEVTKTKDHSNENLANHEEERKSFLEQIQVLTEKIACVQELNQNLNASCNTQEKEKEQLLVQIEELKSNIILSNESLNAEKNTHQQEKDSLQTQIEILIQEKDGIKNSLNEAITDVEHAKKQALEDKEKHHQEMLVLQNELVGAKQSLEDTANSLTKMNKAYQEAEGNASELCETKQMLNDANQSLQQLKTSSEQEKQVLLEKIEAISSEATSIQKSLDVAKESYQSLDSVYETEKESLLKKVAELEEQQKLKETEMEIQRCTIAEREDCLKKLQSSYDSLCQQMEETNAKTLEIEKGKNIAHEELKNAQEKLVSLEKELAHMEEQCKDITRVQDQLAMVENEKQNSEQEATTLVNTNKDLLQKIHDLECKLVEKSEKICELEASRVVSHSQVNLAKEEAERESGKVIEELKTKLKNMEEKAREEQHAAVQKLKATYKEQMTVILKQTSEQEKKIAESDTVKQKYELAKKKLSETVQQLNQQKKVSESYQDQLNKYESHVAKLTETVKKESSRSSALSEKLTKYTNEWEPKILKMTEMETSLKRYISTNRSLESQLSHAQRTIQDMKKDERRQSYFSGFDDESDNSQTLLLPESKKLIKGKENRNMEPPRFSSRASLRSSSNFPMEQKSLKSVSESNLNGEGPYMSTRTRHVKSTSTMGPPGAKGPSVKVDNVRESLGQIPRTMMPLFRCEDEEEHDFSNTATYLSDIKGRTKPDSPTDWRRVSELQRRNSLYPAQMRSAYPGEMQSAPLTLFTDDQIRNGNALSPGSLFGITKGTQDLEINSPPAHNLRKRKSFDSSVNSTPVSSPTPRRSKRLSRSYSRPGPPTPGKRGSGRRGQDLNSSQISSDSVSSRASVKSMKTPKMRTNLSTATLKSSKGSPGKTGRTPSSILRIMSKGRSPWKKLRSDENRDVGNSGGSSAGKRRIFRNPFGGKNYNLLSASARAQEKSSSRNSLNEVIHGNLH